MRILSIGAVMVLAATAAAQPAPKSLGVVPDLRVDVKQSANPKDAIIAIGPKGQIASATRFAWQGINVFDSTGKPLWRLVTGPGDKSEIGAPSAVGWIGTSDTMWVADAMFDRQIVLIDGTGTVIKSIESPSWIHPSWADRRKYPVFGRMDAVAMLSDQTMLIIPSRPKSLIDTPGYDRTQPRILRATWDGAIRASVAVLPRDTRALRLQAKGCNHTIGIPFAATQYTWVSPDGARIGVLATSTVPADSGALRLTLLNDRGDTVFSRLMPIPVERVPQQQVTDFLAGVNACGSFTADALRDSARARVVPFRTAVTDFKVGRDHSTWILLKGEQPADRKALIADDNGEIVGLVTLPPNAIVHAPARDHYWAFEPGKPRMSSTLVRYRVTPATGAPPTRTAPAAASSKAAKPPE